MSYVSPDPLVSFYVPHVADIYWTRVRMPLEYSVCSGIRTMLYMCIQWNFYIDKGHQQSLSLINREVSFSQRLESCRLGQENLSFK